MHLIDQQIIIIIIIKVLLKEIVSLVFNKVKTCFKNFFLYRVNMFF